MVSQVSLCGWGIDGGGQLLGLLQPGGERDAAHAPCLLVAGPAAACDISAHDALERKHGQLPDHHGISVKSRSAEELRHVRRVCGKHVVRNDVLCVIKPECGHGGQHSAFSPHLVFQDMVKCGDAVCRRNDQAAADVIDFPYLSGFHRCVFLHVGSSCSFYTSSARAAHSS